ncbi:MAG: hypothetical protein RJA44_613 [Pseudomonadota bacterium]
MLKPIILAATLAGAGMSPALAGNYPDRPITFVVPFPAGGPTDKVARDLAEAMRKHLGHQSLVIENVPGAGGTFGHTRVAKAAPDGYTVLVAHIAMATAPSLYRTLQYKAEDFEYLGMINEVPMTVIGRPTLQAGTFAELTRWLHAGKGRINLANAGLGSASHLCGLLLQRTLKVDMATVTYKGTGPAMSDLVSGQVDLLCDQTTNTSSQIAAGKVRAYAVTTSRRVDTDALRQLPTLDEAGLKGMQVSIWHGLYAPKGTPQPVLDKLNSALKAALKDADFIKREQALGAVIISDDRSNPAEHRRFVAAEAAKWAPIIKAAGLNAD